MSAEADLERALAALPADFEVFRSPRWRDERRQVHEADLVILHARYGVLLCLVERLRVDQGAQGEGASQRAVHRGHQLGAHLHALLGRQRLATPIKLPYAWAVIYPDGRVTGAGVVNGEGATIDALGVVDLAASLEGVYLFHKQHLRDGGWRPPQEELAAVREALRALSREGRAAPLDPTLIYDEAALIGRLSEQQAESYRWALEAQRTATYGAAGTGKTEVALCVARGAARAGQRALLLCVNKALRVALERRVKGDRYSRGGALRVASVHSLVLELTRELGLEPGALRFDASDPDALDDLLYAINQRRDQLSASSRFDVIVIDEGQDLQAVWLQELIEALLSDPARGRAHLFYDDRQRLGSQEGAITEELLTALGFKRSVDLQVNYRNARLVAEAAARVWSEGAQAPADAPQGRRVSVEVGDEKSVAARLRALLAEGLRPRDLVVLSPRGDGGALLGAWAPERAEGVPLLNPSEEPEAVPRWLNGEGVLLTTARAFKGLEASVALIVDLDLEALGGRFTERDLYVSITRGISAVEVFTRNQAAAARLLALISEEVSS